MIHVPDWSEMTAAEAVEHGQLSRNMFGSASSAPVDRVWMERKAHGATS
jgi:hypothetical protein